jgi:hypothetical protein
VRTAIRVPTSSIPFQIKQCRHRPGDPYPRGERLRTGNAGAFQRKIPATTGPCWIRRTRSSRRSGMRSCCDRELGFGSYGRPLRPAATPRAHTHNPRRRNLVSETGMGGFVHRGFECLPSPLTRLSPFSTVPERAKQRFATGITRPYLPTSSPHGSAVSERSLGARRRRDEQVSRPATRLPHSVQHGMARFAALVVRALVHKLKTGASLRTTQTLRRLSHPVRKQRSDAGDETRAGRPKHA